MNNKRLCKNLIIKDNRKLAIFHNDFDQNGNWLDSYNCSVQHYSTNTYDNKVVFPEKYTNVLDSTGLGFEYYPQARVNASSVDEDTSCHGNCTWFGQVMHSSDITHTQSIARVDNDKNLHSYTAVLSNTDEHGIDQTVHNCMGPSLSQKISGPNCTMSVTNFSCFYDGNWIPIVYLQGKDGLQLAGFYL